MSLSHAIGQFHPLLVHLPIGVLLFAFVLIILQKWQKKDMSSAISLALLWGSISAALSCLAGWYLAQSGEYEADLVQKHQWTAISCTTLGFLSYFFTKQRMIFSTLMALVLTITGHLGGSITHGEDYFFGNSEKALEVAKIVVDSNQTKGLNDSINQEKKTFLYKEKVIPILEKKCYGCHSSKKKKGGLRLDSETFISKGGKNGEILEAGNPGKSSIYSHLILPLDDEKHMPPKGKTQLTSAEISIIHFWIKQGASFTGEITTTKPQLTNLKIPIEVQSVEVPDTTENIEAKKVLPNLKQPDTKILAKLENAKIVVNSEGLGGKKLGINFINVKNFNSSYFIDLEEIKDNVFSLKINNSAFTNEDLKKLNHFKNLEKLNLEQTSISDDGIKNLEDIKTLKYLNLYNTAISDESIEALSSFKNLKVLYLWKTKLTESGVDELRKKMPGTKIEYGEFKFTKPETVH